MTTRKKRSDAGILRRRDAGVRLNTTVRPETAAALRRLAGGERRIGRYLDGVVPTLVPIGKDEEE